jgi:hypothetical protein
VVTPGTARALDEFLRFRHLFRNLNGFELEWSRLRPLLQHLPATAQQVREDVEHFLGFLESTGGGAP